ncbi:MAG TPA: hypothetical protein DCW29_04555 [Janthinobacterium sp.]|nr:hypothetical protein [Janthinobacterium sp.]
MKRTLLLAGACLLAHSMAFGAAPIPQQSGQAAGFYRARLGAFEVVALSDGTAARHIDAILSDPATTRSELRADHLAQPVSLSINAYLINTHAHLVASPHISFPGFGHVRKTGAGYAWLPLPYTDRVAEMDVKP